MNYVTSTSNSFELDVELLKDAPDLNESFVNQDIQFLKDNTSTQKMKAILSNLTGNKLLILINLVLILVIILTYLNIKSQHLKIINLGPVVILSNAFKTLIHNPA